MKRRQFITLTGGAATAWPFEAQAQQSSKKIPTVGVLWHAGSAKEEEVYLRVLVKAFNDLGYIEGKRLSSNIAFLLRIQNGFEHWRETSLMPGGGSPEMPEDSRI